MRSYLDVIKHQPVNPNLYWIFGYDQRLTVAGGLIYDKMKWNSLLIQLISIQVSVSIFSTYEIWRKNVCFWWLKKYVNILWTSSQHITLALGSSLWISIQTHFRCKVSVSIKEIDNCHQNHKVMTLSNIDDGQIP